MFFDGLPLIVGELEIHGPSKRRLTPWFYPNGAIQGDPMRLCPVSAVRGGPGKR